MANYGCYFVFALNAVVLHSTYFLSSSASAEVTKSDIVTTKSTPAGSTKTTSSILPPTHPLTVRGTTLTKVSSSTTSTFDDSWTVSEYADVCPSNVECVKLGGDCIDCDFKFNINCYHGRNVSVTCYPKRNIICKGSRNFTRWFTCRYCYQTPHWQQHCTQTTRCQVRRAPLERYQANCTVGSNILCLGQRKFYKMLRCNWTSGKRWTTALALSITLGGFGADRFYLGLWREGIGKLFSFGGLGIWTLVDVILVATGYVGPADGSLYIF